MVNSYAYYTLDENILSDFQYDANTRQLLVLKRDYPEEYNKSRYRRYFNNFDSGTGFDLTGRLSKDMRKKVARDAELALKLKKERASEI